MELSGPEKEMQTERRRKETADLIVTLNGLVQMNVQERTYSNKLENWLSWFGTVQAMFIAIITYTVLTDRRQNHDL